MAIATLGAAVCLLGAASVFAESGGDVAIEDSGEDRRQLGYILLGSSVLLGLGLAGAYYYIRRRQSPHKAVAFGEDFRVTSTRAGGRAAPTSGASSAAEAGGEQPAIVAEGRADSAVDFARTPAGGPGRECPDCSRTFDSTILVCPYDSTPLRPARRHQARSSLDGGQQRLAHMSCTGCGRRYEPGVEFCYYDGLPLERDTRRKRAGAPSFAACESCGWEGDADASSCPNDGADLVEVNPRDPTPKQPAVPMTICPRCRSYGAFGQAFCPDDGEVLTPVVSVCLSKSPPRGFGPRRKLCTECGWEYSGYARFCSQDGSKLAPLN